ncbi:MAG: hypothetical protein LBB24_02190 [Rickettsiales bacterium]|jgi:hypothetical protein|nr:hypothetical protein [Rickettsiales bacterium]
MPSSYRIPENKVREIETIDHELCLSRGHDLFDNYSAKLYWNCRLKLLDDRIGRELGLKEKNFPHIRELRRMRVVMKNYMERALTRINFFDRKIDAFSNEEPIDKYKLVLRREDAYYYNLLQFSKYDLDVQMVNTKDEIDTILFTRRLLDTERKKTSFKKNLEKYPECARFDLSSKEFTSCIEFKTKVENCKSQALKRIEDLEYKNKFDCKNEAIKKYPDHMALYNSEYQKLKSIKRDEFTINKEKDRAIERRLAELNTLISGPRLSAAQLIDLRKFEEQKCNMQKMIESNVSRALLIEDCEKMLKQPKKDDL